MKSVFIIIIRSILSLLLVLLLLLGWGWYMLATSDIPPNFKVEDIHVIISLFIMVFIVLLVTIIITKKNQINGSYLLLISGIILLFLWIATFNGVNFRIGDKTTNLYAKNIIITGIIISASTVISQLLQIIQFYISRMQSKNE